MANEFVLNNGYKIPAVGLGTWKSQPGQVQSAVEAAIDCGYRHIDCAWLYQNEDEVGDAIHNKIKEGVVKREDMFVTGKLWNIFHDLNDVRTGFQESLSALKLDYIDLFLIHSPMGYKKLKSSEISDEAKAKSPISKNSELVIFPFDESGCSIPDNTDYVAVWKELEKLVDEGLVRSLGISNFNIAQFERLYDEARIKPAVHQFELHPYLSQIDMVDYCIKKGVVITAYSPFASPDRPWKPKDEVPVTSNPVITEIASRVGHSPHQVVLRYLNQRKAVVIPKSVTPKNIQSNIKIFEFNLSSEDMEKIQNLDKNHRILPFVWDLNHKYYPFKENYKE